MIPSNIVNCADLKILYVASNSLMGLNVANQLPLSVTDLDLNFNLYSGRLEFGRNNSVLTNLYLRNNYYSGNIPTEMAWLRNLVKLDLSNNVLTSTLPTAITNVSVIFAV